MCTCRLVDGDINIAQSNAILRHIARKYDMYGSTEAEHCRVDEVLDGISALRAKYVDLVYAKAMVRAATSALTILRKSSVKLVSMALAIEPWCRRCHPHWITHRDGLWPDCGEPGAHALMNIAAAQTSSGWARCQST